MTSTEGISESLNQQIDSVRSADQDMRRQRTEDRGDLSQYQEGSQQQKMQQKWSQVGMFGS